MNTTLRMQILLLSGCALFLGVLGMRFGGEHLRRTAAAQLWARDGEEARQWFVLASRVDPLDYRGLVGQADTLLEAGHQPWLGTPEQIEPLEKAILTYREAIRHEPGDPNTWAQMARAYQALAVARRASRPIDLSGLGDAKATREPEDDLAVAAITRALELEPSNYIYVDYLAGLRYAQGYEDALDWYRRGARILPRMNAHPYLADPAEVPDEVAQAAVLGARDALGARNVVVDSQILAEISLFHSRRGRYQEAADVCLEAIDAGHPFSAELWTRRGLWLDRVGKVDLARQAFLRSLEIKPDRALSHFGLAQIAEREGDLEEALARFRVARDQAPKILRFQLAFARALDGTGRTEEATRVYQSVLHIPGGEIPAATALVDLLRRRGIYDQALVHAKRLMELHPGEEVFERQVGELQTHLTF
jgi:tetratricopeptide (TPR) repeat protein